MLSLLMEYAYLKQAFCLTLPDYAPTISAILLSFLGPNYAPSMPSSTMPQFCSNYASTMPFAPNMPKVCPNYAPSFASTMFQLCPNYFSAGYRVANIHIQIIIFKYMLNGLCDHEKGPVGPWPHR